MSFKNVFFIVFLSMILLGCSDKRLYVKYGQAQQRFADSSFRDGVIRISMDRFGTIYPDMVISDQLIKKHYSVLKTVLDSNTEVLNQALTRHHLPAGSTAQQLQDTLISRYAAQINQAAKEKKIVFIIHGFNKHPFKPTNASAYQENRDMREKINQSYGAGSIQFVELYWDGLTWVNGISFLAPFSSMKIWNNAQPASTNVGLELRRILYRLNLPETYIITHSLGASVATTAVFNVDKYNDGRFRQGYLRKFSDTLNYRTPAGKFRLALLAPATPGKATFDDFYVRTPRDTAYPVNCSVLVGFNENDRVLRKFKLVKPRRIGSTTLGCDPDELNQSMMMVNSHGNLLFDTVSFSYRERHKKQKAHAFHEYVKNEAAMNQFLAKLFGH